MRTAEQLRGVMNRVKGKETFRPGDTVDFPFGDIRDEFNAVRSQLSPITEVTSFAADQHVTMAPESHQLRLLRSLVLQKVRADRRTAPYEGFDATFFQGTDQLPFSFTNYSRGYSPHEGGKPFPLDQTDFAIDGVNFRLDIALHIIPAEIPVPVRLGNSRIEGLSERIGAIINATDTLRISEHPFISYDPRSRYYLEQERQRNSHT